MYDSCLLRTPTPATKSLLMGAQKCELFNLINSRVTGVTLCYLESLILHVQVTYP